MTASANNHRPLLFLCALVAPLATFIVLYFSTELQAHLDRSYFVSPQLRAQNCDAVLKAGRYLDDPSFRPTRWQPDGCVMHPYNGASALHDFTQCFDPGDEIIIAGDSTARQVYYGLVSALQPAQHFNISKREDLVVRVNGVSLRYFWSAYLDKPIPDIFRDIAANGEKSTYKQVAMSMKTDPTRRSKTHVFFTGGLWHAWYKTKQEGLRIYYKAMLDLFEIFRTAPSGVFDNVYFSPIMIPSYSQMTQNRWTFDVFTSMYNFTDSYFGFQRDKQTSHGGPGGAVYKDSGEVAMYYTPFVQEMGGENHYGLYDQSGIHFNDIGRYMEPAVLLNHMCNQVLADKKTAGFSGTCCVAYPGMAPVAQAVLLALVTVALAAVVFAGAPGLKSAVPFVTVLASAWAAAYVYLAERTNALSKIALHFEPAKFALLVQLAVLLALFWPARAPYGYHAATPVWRIPVGLLAPSLLSEFKGVCVALLLIVEVTGYDKRPDTYWGELLARLFFSCYAMADVYAFTVDVVRRGSARLYLRRLVHIFLLPGLIALALHHSSSPAARSLFQALSDLSPIAAKLFFWYSFVVVAVQLVRVLAGRLGQPLGVQVAVLVAAAAATFVVRSLLAPAGPAAQVRKTPAGTMVNLGDTVYNKQHPVLGDFWPLFAAFFAAWWGSTATKADDQQQNAVVPPRWALVSVGAAAAVVANVLHRVLRFQLPSLLIAPNTRSFMDISADRYAEAIVRRGLAYTPLAHAVVCAVAVLFWALCRLAVLHVTRAPEGKDGQPASDRYTYMGGFVWLSGCAYEVLVLRPHVLLAAGGVTLLHVLPTGTGATFSRLVERTFGVVPKDAAFGFRDFPGVAWTQLLEWLNLCVVVSVCLAVAATVAVGWQLLEEDDN